jgi:hypothetical protein
MWTVVPRYTMQLQFRICRLQYSTERYSAAIGDMSGNLCALHCKLCAKYRAHPPDYAIWMVVPPIYCVITAPHNQASIFNWTYLRRYWRYLDNSMRVTLPTWCQIQPTSSNLRYVNCGPEIYNAISVPHMQASIFNWMYLCCYRGYIDNSMCVILQTWCQVQRTPSSLRYLNCGPWHIQCIFSSTYSGFNIQMIVSALL